MKRLPTTKMPALISEATAAEYVAICERRTRRFRWHPQYEDLLAEAVLEALTAVASLPPAERGKAHGIVWVTAAHGASEFLRSPKNDLRTRNYAGNPISAVLSLDALLTADGERREYRASLPYVPDFAPQVVEALWRQWVWREFWVALPPERQQVVREWLRAPHAAAAAATRGENKAVFHRRLQRSLNILRRRWGAPLKDDAGVVKEAVDPRLIRLSPVDAALASAYQWRERSDSPGSLYASREGARAATVRLATLVAEAMLGRAIDGEKERVVRHQAGGLDYRRENLAVVTVHAAKMMTQGRWLEKHREEGNRRKREYYAAHRESERERQRQARARQQAEREQAGASDARPDRRGD